MTTKIPSSSNGAKKSNALIEPWQWQLLTLSTLVKLALLPTYHSTDFEVHRNWLAITHSLPVSQWYFDETSKWTLDYPPFFAYLSWLLSIPAAWWDPRIVDLHGGLDYDAWSCKVYMRASVVLTELTFATALFALSRTSSSSSTYKAVHQLPAWCAAAMLMHPGLIIVDHIHFQYNGFLYGILLWSIWAARQDRPLLCAFLFSTLLNFKHIYVYVAPAFFVYLLQSYVLRAGPHNKTEASATSSVSASGSGERLFTLATITTLPFAASLLPLALSGLSSGAPAGPAGIIAQMLQRLFPFSRGLNHAYWAANAWALYTFADRVLVKLLGIRSAHGNVTRGILGDTHFDVLPAITAGHCFLLTLVVTLALCTRLWTRPTYGTFVESIGLFGLTSFMLGFHVHEKAILIALLPLTLLSCCSYTMIRKTFVLSVAGTVGLFPLLFEAREVPIKILYLLLWLIVTPIISTFGMRLPNSMQTPTNWDLLVHFAEDVYVGGFVLLVAFVELIHPLVFGRGPFGLYGSPSTPTSTIDKLAASASASAAALSQNRLLSYASAAAASAAEAVSQAVHPSPTTTAAGAVDGAASVVSSAASHASAAGASVFSSVLSAATDATSASSSAGQAAQVAEGVGRSISSAAAAVATSIVAQPAQSLASVVGSSSSVGKSFGRVDTASVLEFLPLMMTSVYCAIGVAWVWISLSARFLRGADDAGDGEGEQAKSIASVVSSKKAVPAASKVVKR